MCAFSGHVMRTDTPWIKDLFSENDSLDCIISCLISECGLYHVYSWYDQV